MIKKIVSVLTLFVVLSGGLHKAFGQNLNPQPNFATQALSASPSVYLNYNDLTASFKDQISENAFTNVETSQIPNSTQITPTGSPSKGYAIFSLAPLAAGSLQSISLRYYSAPAAGPQTIIIGTGTEPSFTVVASFTVNVAATTAVQTFVSGTNFPAITVAAGEFIGTWNSSSTLPPGQVTGSGTSRCFFSSPSSVPSGVNTYTCDTGLQGEEGVVLTTVTSGTVIPRQSGFDSAQVDNTSAAFPYNGWNAAPMTCWVRLTGVRPGR